MQLVHAVQNDDDDDDGNDDVNNNSVITNNKSTKNVTGNTETPTRPKAQKHRYAKS